jgi:hypothetical protein
MRAIIPWRVVVLVSLWGPRADWLANDISEPALLWLPSNLWIIGLGNPGQAFAWAAMPRISYGGGYPRRSGASLQSNTQ